MRTYSSKCSWLTCGMAGLLSLLTGCTIIDGTPNPYVEEGNAWPAYRYDKCDYK